MVGNTTNFTTVDKDQLFALVCKKMETLIDKGSNLFLGDYDGRTPLHIAACEGHLKLVKYLLSHGATVYAKDRYGDTPLCNAVRFRQKEVVKLLRKTGAHFSRDELEEAGTELCSLAASGDMEGLEIWSLAGADLNKPGYDGQSAILVAEAAGKKEMVAFLHQLKKKTVIGEFNECDEYDDDDEVNKMYCIAKGSSSSPPRQDSELTLPPPAGIFLNGGYTAALIAGTQLSRSDQHGPHSSLNERLTAPSPLPLISSLRQELSIFAKRFSQSRSVHREKLQRSHGQGDKKT
ncbi:hypothetical protein F7725_008001 [Dissostichus mawsoni]|uniref:Uncharacterized protein n=1 Tax=Dissostichus mawsoni TaxID=36200 RepID=A0A7J5Y909_DISMA|nr:hypothetical protein F7725_008001 [Dissostichus mawsoni]